ncbi:MAG: hypothetical protein IJZ64_01295 [Ruminococcus sp.]|nr:hypothetical protein [Ruminococcus sp.]
MNTIIIMILLILLIAVCIMCFMCVIGMLALRFFIIEKYGEITLEEFKHYVGVVAEKIFKRK